MTFRKSILVGLLAVLSTPAMSRAASSGLSEHEIRQGQVPLLSERAAKGPPAAPTVRPSARATEQPTEDARHREAMNTGKVRMTVGSMEGSDKR